VRLGVIQREQPIVKTRVGEVVQLDVNDRNQTGPAICRPVKTWPSSPCSEPSLSDVMVYHLIGEEGQVTRRSFDDQEASAPCHFAFIKDFLQWESFIFGVVEEKMVLHQSSGL
jgi:hypothetical protein